MRASEVIPDPVAKVVLPPTLVQMHRGVGQGTLVFFPDFGGNTIYARPMVTALGLAVSCCAMRLSVDMVAALDTCSVEDLGRRFAADLVAANLPRPLHLMGFSFAGCLAYETARQLSQRGAAPDMLWILDLIHRSRFLREFLRSPARHTVGLARYAKRNWRAILLRQPDPNIVVAYGVWRIDMSAHPAAYRPILRGMYAAFLKYRAKASPAPMTVVCASEGARRGGLEEGLGWRGLATGPFAAITVPGDHLTMLQKPENARVIADHVRAVLNKQTAVPEKQIKDQTHD